ncbi:MAG: hypothetical protein LBJ93_01005 [Clostridiales bacterium]|jgi:hypothetical protein|nr:hypothetical protein [Clostridiales bacterium]
MFVKTESDWLIGLFKKLGIELGPKVAEHNYYDASSIVGIWEEGEIRFVGQPQPKSLLEKFGDATRRSELYNRSQFEQSQSNSQRNERDWLERNSF